MRPGCLPEKNWGAARQAADQIVEQYRLADGAAEGTRTPDPLITNEVLYQLSYRGYHWV